MNSEELQKKFHSRFQGPRYIECNNGWLKLIEDFLTELDTIDPNKELTIFSIKEKFGLLRIYINQGASSEVSELIGKYEEMSRTVCEVCGLDTGLV
jgi:hypothetical protein